MKLVAIFGAFLMAAAPLAAQEGLPLVKLHKVEADGEGLERQFFGRVVAKQTVDLAFQVPGQIVEFPVLEGTTVPEGGVIARLDQEPFQLTLDQAKAQADQATRTLARLEKLSGSTVSQVSVDDAKTKVDLTAIAVRNAERSLEEAELHAPFDALVATRNVANFTTIGAGNPVVRLHDMSEIRIEIDVPEILFQNASRKAPPRILADFPGSDKEYVLEPREFNAETSSVGQTFKITLGMAPEDGLNVLPGSSVRVNVFLEEGAGRITIPVSSLITANDGTPQVMLFQKSSEDEGTVSLSPVQIEPSGMGQVVVTGGLEAGQEIVASGGNLLESGAKVRRFTGFVN